MGKGSSAPKTPDYTAAAEATSQGNLDLARYNTQANRINQYTPWGSLTYTNDRSFDQNAYDAAMAAYNRQTVPQPVYGRTSDGAPQGVSWAGMDFGQSPQMMQGSALAPPNADDFWTGGDNWTQTMQLSPELQSLLDQQWSIQQGLAGPQNDALKRVQGMMGSGFDTSGMAQGGTALDLNSLPGMGSVYDPTLQTNNATELLMQRISPELDRQREALRAQLANQGIAQGSPAYNNAMEQLGQSANDAYTQASLAGIGLGMQQQGLQFNQQQGLRMGEAGLQGQQFNQAEQARQRDFMEQSYLRNLPLQELQMLMGQGSVQMPQFPGYVQQGQTAGPDYLGATGQQYNADVGRWNAGQAQQQQMQQGLGQMGGALGSMFGGPIGGLLGSAGGSILGGLFG